MNNTYQVCNIDYDNELNKRLQSRFFPSRNLQPNFDFRPMSTKYQKFPVLNEVKYQKMENMKKYNPETVFYPGTSKAPVHYALDNVDTESKLRNQFFALQRNDQATYIPPMNSSLYHMQSKVGQKPQEIENQGKVDINFNPDRCNLAPQHFNNSTRYNLKNM